jgi:hypothetical protein
MYLRVHSSFEIWVGSDNMNQTLNIYIYLRPIFVDSLQNFGKRSEKSYRSIFDTLKT